MKELNSLCQAQYKQALINPSLLTEEDLLQLIVRYPYSQPLIFAYERRKIQQGDCSSNKSLALLYAPNSGWLYSFVHSKPMVEAAEESAVSTTESVLSVDVGEEEQLDEDHVESSEDVVELVDEEEKSDLDALDFLLSQGGVGADYFVFEGLSETEETAPVSSQKASVHDEEDVSLYNDELMPYSFRWWLHKTRLEHADTYQPFASVQLGTAGSGPVNFGKLDEAILDQQIKENIIHFQDPEAKLSEQVKSRPVAPVLPKKTDGIIERFIREEPIIQAPSAENLNNENMARQSAEDNYVFVTETLANIYVDQGLTQKAIAVFKKLILKYPEKKSYFADRIEKLEKNL